MANVDYSPLRDAILGKVDFEAEFKELLGPDGVPGKRRCYNVAVHKDRNPSFIYKVSTGAWRCKSCNEHGDLFTLFLKVKGMSYFQTLEHLSTKYRFKGLADYSVMHAKHGKKEQPFPILNDERVHFKLVDAIGKWNEERLDFMFRRYGLTKQTIRRYRIGWDPNYQRVAIPIFRLNEGWHPDGFPKEGFSDYVNVRYHDCFRCHAEWYNEKNEKVPRPKWLDTEAVRDQATQNLHPAWPGNRGKIISVANHGKNYVYPARVFFEEPFFYFVGGEFKALLINQLGRPACTATTGEGAIPPEVLAFVAGRRIRVLMDVDNAGEAAADRVCKAFFLHGAEVERGYWPQFAVAQMPEKGDVTDFLRLADWNIDALDQIEWAPYSCTETLLTSVIDAQIEEEEEIPRDVDTIQFQELQNPRLLRQWIEFRGIISNKGDVPLTAPRRLIVTCKSGANNPIRLCDACKLKKCNYRSEVVLTTDEQLMLLGLPPDKVGLQVLNKSGVPRNCPHPDVETVSSAVEDIILTPTMDTNDADTSQFMRVPAYLLGEERLEVKEGIPYNFTGQIVPHPRHGTFMVAVRRWSEVDDDIFSFRANNVKLAGLDRALGPREPEARITNILSQVRNHVTQIYGQDDLTLVALLSMVMPFRFRLAQYAQERICPVTMILGDTTVGKSVVTSRLLKHYGAGRIFDGASNITHAGLIGGVSNINNKPRFAWGAVPSCHRGWLGIDEFNKIDEARRGELTQLITTGIAQRVTAYGSYSIASNVRMTLMCNPRDNRSLTSFANPLDAVLRVMGSPQDAGRLELIHIQYRQKDNNIFREVKRPDVGDYTYTQEHARYHMSYAWSLKEQQIMFDDVQYIFDKSVDLSEELGMTTLFLPAQARFKIARIAAGFAILTMSVDSDRNLIVRKPHVDLALGLVRSTLGAYCKSVKYSSDDTICPKELIEILDKARSTTTLQMFVSGDRWTMDDIVDLFERRDDARMFIHLTQHVFSLITRMGVFYRPVDQRLAEMINSYVAEKERAEF